VWIAAAASLGSVVLMETVGRISPFFVSHVLQSPARPNGVSPDTVISYLGTLFCAVVEAHDLWMLETVWIEPQK
jgi:hypothetical protein